MCRSDSAWPAIDNTGWRLQTDSCNIWQYRVTLTTLNAVSESVFGRDVLRSSLIKPPLGGGDIQRHTDSLLKAFTIYLVHTLWHDIILSYNARVIEPKSKSD